jgi:DNA-binding NarL/FixJ family response regulator
VTTIAIVEDHPLYRQGLIHTVEQGIDLELVQVASTVGDFERADVLADVLLLDLHLPDAEGSDAVTRLLGKAGAILVLSASADRDSVVAAIGAGAKGYLTKAAEAKEIWRAIETVHQGDSYVSPQLAAYLLRDARDLQPSSEFALTPREREVLSLLAEGDTDAEIAKRLYISIRTVRSHLDRIRDKTGRRRRADLTRLAIENEGRGRPLS